MKINIDKFKEKYHDNSDKFVDNWQAGIKLLPFNSNPTSAYDKRCGFQGIMGEFCRIIENDGTKPIDKFNDSIEMPVRNYLLNTNQMEEDKIDTFIAVLKDVLFLNGNLNVTDSSFLKYLPLVPDDETFGEKDKKKYSDGQKKLAVFLYSMLSDETKVGTTNNKVNLFVKILKEALIQDTHDESQKIFKEYTVLPFIKKSFGEDLTWLLEQEESVKIRYLQLLLYFYSCYAVTQTITCLSPHEHSKKTEPSHFYFILSSEKASVKHDAVVLGWSHNIPKTTMDKLFGKSQALDILNTVLSEDDKPVGFYPDIYAALNETPFEENKSLCEDLLKQYQQEKRDVLRKRKTEAGNFQEISLEVNNYDEFVEKVDLLCTGLQSTSYISRLKKKVVDLLSVRFLQLRRGNFVLVLDKEMLTFLIALFTKGKKTKLEEMYKKFNDYGIFFNRGSRQAIEEYLMKLNLLDRRSDSGEAQYVRVIL